MAEFVVDIKSTGSQKVENEINAILTGAKATSTEILALSRTLNTSAKSAAAFAANLGLGAGQTQAAVNRMRALRDSGLSQTQIFRILQKELGLTASQYRGLVAGVKDADAQTKAYTDNLKRQADAQEQSQEASAAQLIALQQVNAAAQQVAAALGGVVRKAVSEFISYDDALTSVSAKTGIAKDQLGFLADAAQEVALATSQSPTGAVKAADSLIALGASAEEAAERLPTVAQLTDALRSVGADIETSAKVVQLGSSIYEEFGETAQTVGDKIAYISDTSAVASSTGLQEFLQLFSKAAPITKQLGVSMDELLASFAVLRDAGQAPEVAATSLKSLTSTLIANKDKLAELGVEINDSQGKFKGLAAVFGELGSANLGELLGLTDQQVQEALKATPKDIQQMASSLENAGISIEETNEIFGKIGIASAITLSNEFGTVIEKTEELGDTFGALERKSAAINSSIAGQIKLLEGSVQTAFVKLGESIGTFTGPAVTATINLVNAFIAADPIIQKFVGGILGIGAALASAVASITGYTLALKALQAAGVGETIAMVRSTVATVANTAARVTQNAVTAASAPLQLRAAAATQFQTLQTTIQSGALAANYRAWLQSAAAQLGASKAAIGTAASTATLGLALAGVAASLALVVDTFNSVNNAANATKAANKDVLKSFEEYQKVLISSGESGIVSLEELGQTQREVFESSLNFLQRGLESWRNTIASFANDSGLNELAEAFLNRRFVSGFEAAQIAASKAFTDLTLDVGNLEQAFLDLNASGFEPGSEAAKALAGSLEGAITALQNAQLVSEDDIAIRDAQVARLQNYINKLNGVEVATEEATAAQEESNDAVRTAAQLQAALSDELAQREIASINARTEAYAQFGADKEGLERRLTEIEEQELRNRIAAQRKFIADAATTQFETAEAKAKAIADAEKIIADTELQLAKNAASRAEATAQEQQQAAEKAAQEQERIAEEAAREQERLAEEAARERERIERERLETEAALRESAFAEEMRQLDEQQREYLLYAEERVRAQEDILESLDDENDAIGQQIALNQLRLEQQDLLTQKRLAGLSQELADLESAGDLLRALKSEETSIAEQQLIRQRLREMGISETITELELATQILDKQEEQRKAEFEAFQRRQIAERQTLVLQQEQERIGLRRQAAEAEITRIKADQLVIEAQLNQLRAQAELAAAQERLALAQQQGASQAEIVRLQTEIATKEQALQLSGDAVTVAQEGAVAAFETAQDAADALVEYEQIATAQTQNLTLMQQIALEQERAADAAERWAAEIERVRAMESETANQPVATIEPRLRGGPVSPSGLYQVNEAGIEAFKPLGRPAVPLTNVPAYGLFRPKTPGHIIPAPMVARGGGMGAVISELRALRQQVASRPINVEMPATFYNNPSPLETRLQLANARLKMSRGL